MRSVLVAALLAFVAVGPLAAPVPASAEVEHAATYTVVPRVGMTVPILDGTSPRSPRRDHLVWPDTAQAECWGRYQSITFGGYTGNVWVRIRLDYGSIGWIPVVALQGDYKADLPASARC
ncbi:hypothetical protein [Nocardiopsis flavescens]|uniref:hypothetical protein n=1 Tax=Nocardiopsis flavescens TaxID=758803 RepID=UPI000932C7C6|nr:hypothetical protein [Nocardiopsis flavescens]